MPVILTLILSLLTVGCVNTNQPKVDDRNSTKPKSLTIESLPISPQISMLENRTEYEEDKSIAPHISGRYELETGTDHQTNISQAYMVIEKLDALNYGYYYAIKDGKAVANGTFGIFRYRDGTFLNKVVEGDSTVTTLNHNITLITEGQLLKLVVENSFGKKVIIWSRVLEDDKTEDESLTEAIKDAKISYTQIYKEKFDTFTEKEGY